MTTTLVHKRQKITTGFVGWALGAAMLMGWPLVSAGAPVPVIGSVDLFLIPVTGKFVFGRGTGGLYHYDYCYQTQTNTLWLLVPIGNTGTAASLPTLVRVEFRPYPSISPIVVDVPVPAVKPFTMVTVAAAMPPVCLTNNCAVFLNVDPGNTLHEQGFGRANNALNTDCYNGDSGPGS